MMCIIMAQLTHLVWEDGLLPAVHGVDVEAPNEPHFGCHQLLLIRRDAQRPHQRQEDHQPSNQVQVRH